MYIYKINYNFYKKKIKYNLENSSQTENILFICIRHFKIKILRPSLYIYIYISISLTFAKLNPQQIKYQQPCNELKIQF